MILNMSFRNVGAYLMDSIKQWVNGHNLYRYLLEFQHRIQKIYFVK